jgi:2-dehydropantoate 2-reductase
MNVLVMGAGALGSVFGGFLAKAGHQVTLVGRAPHMAAIQDHGLQILGIWGEHLIDNLGACTTTAEVRREDLDLVLITTKSYDAEHAARQILPLLSEKTLVISAQNGLGNVETISQVIGDHRATAARVIFGVEAVAPGRVEITVYADNVMLGSPSDRVNYKRILETAGAFTQAGIPTEATREIDKFIWGKVLYNCSLNALSALLEVAYGELGERVETREIMASVIQEIFAVAQRKGVGLAWTSPPEYEKLLLERLIPDTYSHHASMLQDVSRGKRTEIDSMNGAITRLGEELGIPTPVNRMLTQLVKAKEQVSKGRQPA